MLKIGNYQFTSRLFLGTGKFENFDIQKRSVDASENAVLTSADRRMKIYEPHHPNFLEKIELNAYKFLPNTAGAKTAEEAVRIAKLANASGLCHMVKVEIIRCDKT